MRPAARARRPSVDASGGSPRSSHEPSGRRISSLALGELGERGRDGRAAGADELAEDPVGQRQRHDHAVAGDAAPALGEMPEQRLQPAVDARELRDRLGGGEAQRALAEAVEQRGGDLGLARDLGGEAAVEHGDASSGDSTRPHGVDGQQARLGCRVCHGRSRSPGPSSSALTWSATISSRESTPSSTSRPTWSALAPDRRDDVPGADAEAGGCARRARARPRRARLPASSAAEVGVGLEQPDGSGCSRHACRYSAASSLVSDRRLPNSQVLRTRGCR